MARNSAPRFPANGSNEIPAKRLLRCAIYTRKSTEEGLQREFNSLDAQREAAEAFIVSQKNEGWQVSRPRIPRIARLMALAIKFQDMINRGEVRDYADLARLGYVTRARITQIMNLLLLAPDIQEEIMGLGGVPGVFDGVKPGTHFGFRRKLLSLRAAGEGQERHRD
jgi:hypothetical protein